MVNSPQPPNPPDQPTKPENIFPATPPDNQQKNTGDFQLQMSHQWLGMNFTPKEWHQLMNIFLKGFGDYVNKLSQEAIKKMKENQRREQGND